MDDNGNKTINLHDSGINYYDGEYHNILHSSLIQDEEYYFARSRASKEIIFSGLDLENKNLIEYGCGIGVNIASVKNACGVDVSKLALETCKKRGVSTFDSIENVPQSYWDIVLCSHVLEHLENPYNHLLLLERLLKDDGILILILPKENHCSHKNNYEDDKNQHLYSWNFRTINNLLNRSGFMVKKQYYQSVLGYRVLLPIYRLLGLKPYIIAVKIMGTILNNTWLVVHAEKRKQR